EPDAGDTVGAIHGTAVHIVVRIYVSVLRHACMGAMGRGSFSDDARAEDRTRHPAQGQRRHGDSSRTVADRRLYLGRRGDRDLGLSGDTGLTLTFSLVLLRMIALLHTAGSYPTSSATARAYRCWRNCTDL